MMEKSTIIVHTFILCTPNFKYSRWSVHQSAALSNALIWQLYQTYSLGSASIFVLTGIQSDISVKFYQVSSRLNQARFVTSLPKNATSSTLVIEVAHTRRANRLHHKAYRPTLLRRTEQMGMIDHQHPSMISTVYFVEYPFNQPI